MFSLPKAFVSLLIAQLVVSAPATSSPGSGEALTLDLPGPDLELSRTGLLPAVNLSGASNGNCASSYKFHTWKTENWHIEDCYSTVHQFYISEVLTHPDEPFEFVDRWASATKPELTPQRTPRKYIVRSCVLTVMMLDWFRPGELPAGTVVSQPKTDVSTYRKIYTAAKGIETACTQTRIPGWAMIGDKSAMGVFVWSKDSYIDEMTGGFPVVVSSPTSNASSLTSTE